VDSKPITFHWRWNSEKFGIISSIWTNCNINQKLAIIEMLYYADQTAWNSQLLAVAVGEIYSLCKSTGLTEAWLERRLTLTSTEFPALQINDKVTKEIVELFQRHFLPKTTPVEKISNYIQSIYPSFSDNQLASLNWIIEQSRNPGCTHAISFARALVLYRGLPLRLLEKVPDATYIDFINMCVRIIIDPWGSIFVVKYPASAYPDLSNFEQQAMKLEDQQFRKYAGSHIDGGKCTKSEISAFVTTCKAMEEMVQEERGSPAAILSTILPDVSVRELNGVFYAFTSRNVELRFKQ
jgi:hypothetical protein